MKAKKTNGLLRKQNNPDSDNENDNENDSDNDNEINKSVQLNTVNNVIRYK